MDDRIKVFHLEDYKIMRDGIKFLLTQDPGIVVVGEARKGEELIEKLPGADIDVLLLDIYLDGMEEHSTLDGFGVCEYVHQNYPGIKIVAHSVYYDADRVARIMNNGAMGFVSKKAGYEELIEAIKSVHSGKKYICKETSKKLKNINEFLEGIVDTLRGEKDFFSQREKDVLDLLARGFSTKNIAQELFITEKTVESHRKNMVDKARVKNTAELIAFASARGFLKR
ncbi:response regulator transcription factor [Terrimonas sp. NA20]|uniref:Response regulator transcription factor n=1 Tax=Terrimonas ginsenosidimutans TaxID=2908004 RepID=A0ABS9KWS0_9BACT|nr:response regulator transcription factor [Terrimonas ginsenosidimutans]MCG2616791.1 response regulator transcription factor [Terrimonas ginsenosidimutans]